MICGDDVPPKSLQWPFELTKKTFSCLKYCSAKIIWIKMGIVCRCQKKPALRSLRIRRFVEFELKRRQQPPRLDFFVDGMSYFEAWTSMNPSYFTWKKDEVLKFQGFDAQPYCQKGGLSPKKWWGTLKHDGFIPEFHAEHDDQPWRGMEGTPCCETTQVSGSCLYTYIM